MDFKVPDKIAVVRCCGIVYNACPKDGGQKIEDGGRKSEDGSLTLNPETLNPEPYTLFFDEGGVL